MKLFESKYRPRNIVVMLWFRAEKTPLGFTFYRIPVSESSEDMTASSSCTSVSSTGIWALTRAANLGHMPCTT